MEIFWGWMGYGWLFGRGSGEWWGGFCRGMKNIGRADGYCVRKRTRLGYDLGTRGYID